MTHGHYDQLAFIPGIQGFFNICRSKNVLHCINKLKCQRHMSNSVDTENYP